MDVAALQAIKRYRAVCDDLTPGSGSAPRTVDARHLELTQALLAVAEAKPSSPADLTIQIDAVIEGIGLDAQASDPDRIVYLLLRTVQRHVHDWSSVAIHAE